MQFVVCDSPSGVWRQMNAIQTWFFKLLQDKGTAKNVPAALVFTRRNDNLHTTYL